MEPSAKISIKTFFMEIIFFSVHSAAVLGKNASIRSKLPTAVCWSQEKREKDVKLICFMSKVTLVHNGCRGNYGTTSKSFIVFFAH